MPKKETVEEFIRSVEHEPHDVVIEKYYADDATMRENQDRPRVGLLNLIKHEQKATAKAARIVSKCIRPVFIEDDVVMIRWKFRFEWLDNSITEIEEIACQLWEGDKIKEEQFFYDPKQLVPEKPAVKKAVL